MGRRAGAAPDADRAEGAAGTARSQAELVEAAREAALRLLTAKARTRVELERRLARGGLPAGAVATALDRLERVGLVDDAAVAAAHAEQRAAGGMAAEAIGFELRQRGVPADLADQAVRAATGDVDEYERCRRAAVARAARLGDLPPEVRRRRLVGFLARRGYSPDLASRAAGEVVRLALDVDSSRVPDS